MVYGLQGSPCCDCSTLVGGMRCNEFPSSSAFFLVLTYLLTCATFGNKLAWRVCSCFAAERAAAGACDVTAITSLPCPVSLYESVQSDMRFSAFVQRQLHSQFLFSHSLQLFPTTMCYANWSRPLTHNVSRVQAAYTYSNI